MRNWMNYFDRMQYAIDYIETNLTQMITLEDLAAKAHFSRYHFHRIFQTMVGDTVMDYIRKRRLVHAADELIQSNKKIIDIAMENQFNSHDVFIRAFKKEFGITPGHYRKLNRQFIYFKKWEKPIQKERSQMLDLSYSPKLHCSNSDKLASLEILHLVLSLAEKARKEGLLSLEKEITDSFPFLLHKGLDLIITGTEPSLVQEIMIAFFMAGDYQGKEFLTRLIIIEGILCIQRGEHPRMIQEKLSAYFGEDFQPEIEKRFGINKAVQVEELQKFIQTIGDNPPLNLQTTILEDLLTKIDNRSCQRLLRDIDYYDVAYACQGTSGKATLKIFKNISQEARILLKEELENFRGISINEIIRAQNKILEIYQRLKLENEVL